MYAAFSCHNGNKGRDRLAKIPENVVEDIRNQVDITDIVSQYVQLKKSGKNYFGLCPFHEERTPSFSVSEDKQIFHCFSCGRGGNVFKFIMDIDQLSFPEAVAKVADMNNITLDPSYLQTNATPASSHDQKLRQLYQQAQTLYHHILVNTQLGQKALKYLHQRGMTDEMIETFGVGYAPDDVQLLPLFFKNKSVELSLLDQSGLLTVTEDEHRLSRFVDRIMFPIRDQGGQTIAFSGRILKKDLNKPKYLNSPETVLFNKRKVLFNFDLAKSEIRKTNGVVLFEGFMDVIAAYQAGLKNGVASMGTSLTDEQLYALQRMTNHLVICYDGDEPGLKATNRAVDMLMPKAELDIGVVSLPNGLDPDEFIKAKGPAAFVNVIQNTEQTSIQFKLNYLKRHVNLNQDKFKFDYLDQALDLLQHFASPSEQDLYLKELSTTLSIDLTALKAQFAELVDHQKRQHGLSAKGKYQRHPEPVGTLQAKSGKTVHYDQLEQAQRLLLHYALHDIALCHQLANNSSFTFKESTYQTIFELWLTYISNHEAQSISAFIDQLPAEMQNTIADLEMSRFPENYDNLLIQDLLTIIGLQDLKQQLRDAKQSLKIANETGNVDEELYWTTEIIKLSKNLKGA